MKLTRELRFRSVTSSIHFALLIGILQSRISLAENSALSESVLFSQVTFARRCMPSPGFIDFIYDASISFG